MARTAASARLRDAAVLLPLVGLFLLMPPFITLFAVDFRLFGIPLLVVYLFGVWAALIIVALLLAWRLPEPEPAPTERAAAANESAPASEADA